MAHILVVDDDKPMLQMLETSLIKLGHRVSCARDGTEALERSKAEIPEVLLTDIIMPEKEGLETIQIFRRNYPQVKIIAMSGGGRGDPSDYLHIAKKMGAMLALVKPFSIEQVQAAIAEVLGAEATSKTTPGEAAE